MPKRKNKATPTRKRPAAKKKRAPSKATRVHRPTLDLTPPSLLHPEKRTRVLPLETVERLLSIALARSGGSSGCTAEVYAERTVVTALSLDEGVIRSAQVSETTGVGIRVVNGAQDTPIRTTSTMPRSTAPPSPRARSPTVTAKHRR